MSESVLVIGDIEPKTIVETKENNAIVISEKSDTIVLKDLTVEPQRPTGKESKIIVETKENNAIVISEKSDTIVLKDFAVG
ncbi:MAG: hypothetical protein ACPLYF_01300, partial [Fervidobacterium sp.]